MRLFVTFVSMYYEVLERDRVRASLPIALSGGTGVDELVGGADAFSSLSVMVDVEAVLEEKMEGGPR